MNSPDIIKDASDALQQISDRGITVMQGWYDKDIHETHVTLWDLGEVDENFSDYYAEGVSHTKYVSGCNEEESCHTPRVPPIVRSTIAATAATFRQTENLVFEIPSIGIMASCVRILRCNVSHSFVVLESVMPEAIHSFSHCLNAVRFASLCPTYSNNSFSSFRRILPSKY